MFRPNFRFVSESTGPNCSPQGGHKPILDAVIPVEFPTCCFISKSERLKCDCGQKSKPNIALLTPIKFREGVVKMSDQFYEFNLIYS